MLQLKLIMGRITHKNHGFSLIEVVVVLAISSLLLLILAGGYSILQQRNRFKDGVERIVSTLERTRTEANSTLNVTNPAPGTNENRLVFAKAVHFTDGSDTLQLLTLSADNDETLGLINLETTETAQIPWRVGFDESPPSSATTVVFARSPVDGTLQTHIFDLRAAGVGPGSPLYDEANYNNPIAADRQFVFTNPDGLQATITVNGETGNVSVAYDN